MTYHTGIFWKASTYEEDIIHAEAAGRASKVDFIENRLEAKDNLFESEDLGWDTKVGLNHKLKEQDKCVQTTGEYGISSSGQITVDASQSGFEEAPNPLTCASSLQHWISRQPPFEDE